MKRREFTEAVKDTIATATGKPIGKAEAPDGGGWQGEVNDSDFVPYTVITPMSSPQGEGPLGDPQADVQLIYAMTSFGVSSDQCEWMADLARGAASEMKKDTVAITDESDRLIRMVWITEYGGVERGGEEPPYYAQTDIAVFDTTPA